jgi:hypothetical protein
MDISVVWGTLKNPTIVLNSNLIQIWLNEL